MATYDMTLSTPLTAASIADGALTAQGPATEGLVLSGLVEAVVGLVLSLSETVNFDDDAIAVFVGEAVAADTLILADNAVSVSLLIVDLAETLILGDQVTPNAVLNALAEERLVLVAIVSVGGEEYVAWVANAETFAHSQYAHFNFNSMCRLGNRYYGANEDGIYLLEGDDDAGADIQYFATLPQTEFEHSGLKRVPRAYMGFNNSGDMHLKIVTPDKREYVYRFNPTPAGQTEALAKIGRGITARYFTFDVYNFEGGQAELDRIEFFPLFMRRLF